MRRLLLLLTILANIIMAKAQIKQPDFAFPKTVSKDAIADLKKANAAKDAAASLNALLRLTVAETLIDADSLQACINRIHDTSMLYTDSELCGIFYALEAKVYSVAYNQQSWKYNRRNLPLTPLPADITEWSGDQYKAKIRELVELSIGTPSIQKLKALDILKYSNIVSIDKSSAVFYPTLADFVYVNAYDLLQPEDRDKISDSVIRLNQNSNNLAAVILWQTELTEALDDRFEALDSLYDKYADSEYSAIIIDAMANADGSDDVERQIRCKTLIDAYLAKYPKSLFANNLKNDLNYIIKENIVVDVPSICCPNVPFKVKIKNHNSNKYKINAYYLGEKLNNNEDIQKLVMRKIAEGHPTLSVDMICTDKVPFRVDSTVEVKLSKYGYYAIVPVSSKDKKDDAHDYYTTTRCLPVYAATINNTEDFVQFIIMDSHTGAPIPGAGLKVSGRQVPTLTAKTDQIGVANLDITAKQGYYRDISVNYNGHDFAFNDLSVYQRNKQDNTEANGYAQVLTDRAIYHPGDEVNVLGIFSSIIVMPDHQSSSELLKNIDVMFVLSDANRQSVGTVETTTDEYGRALANFTLPTDGLTGQYTIVATIRSRITKDVDGDNGVLEHSHYGSRSIMVSDYRMPDFEISIDAVECDTPNKGDVTITGNAMTYSGMPLAEIPVNVKLKKSDFWLWSFDYNPFYTFDITTDAEGRFSTVVPDSVFKQNEGRYYSVTVDATSATGTTAIASRSFALTAKYEITLKIDNKNVNGQLPLKPDVKVMAADGSLTEIPLTWSIEKASSNQESPIASGDYYGIIDLNKIKPGEYILRIKAKDSELANDATASITVYNVASGIVPDEKMLWVKDNSVIMDGVHKANIFIATGSETTYLYYIVISDGKIVSNDVKQLKYGYHTLSVDVPADGNDTEIQLMCLRDCNRESATVYVQKPKEPTIKIVTESFRDNLIPGALETWNFRIVKADGSPIEAALALDMYNKALDALCPQSFGVRFRDYSIGNNVYINGLYKRFYSTTYTQTFKNLDNFIIDRPQFIYLDEISPRYGYNMRRSPYMKQARNSAVMYDMVEEECAVDNLAAPMMMMSAKAAGVAEDCDVVEEVVEDVVVTGYGAVAPDSDSKAGDPEAFDYRDSDIPLAIWAPVLTTNERGEIQYSFTVPNANTTWCLRAAAWTQSLLAADLKHDFVASKPVMVMPNLPRYLRTGDTATLLAQVLNNSDSITDVVTVVEIFNPLTSKIISRKEYKSSIEPAKSATVSIDVEITPDMQSVGYRVRSSNGDFSDGEQNVIRVLPSEASLIETNPFYLNPGETSYSTVLPDDQGARLSLTFSENPSWTIVTALPGLRTEIEEYANSAAAALYSAAISRGIAQSNPKIKEAIDTWRTNPSDSALISMLEKNEDLKQAVLASTPWVLAAQSDTERMANLASIFSDSEIDQTITQAIKILKDLQNEDGGWSWGKWCDSSSFWVTSNVLEGLGDLIRLGWLPKDKDLNDMIKRAVKYLDKEVKDTDLHYALIRPDFTDVPVSANGQKVIAATIKDIKSNWKKYSDPSYKSLAALVLWLNGEKKLAADVMRSVSEFGVYTKSQGLKFPNVNALYSYGVLLDCYARMLPGSKEVDGLRQQLIVRKQGTDWGSSVVTMQVVQSILASGSDWLVPAEGAEIKVGDTQIDPVGPVETATGNLRADLSNYPGQELNITTSGRGPAYGAVYAQFSRRMDQVESYSIDDLSIEKQLHVSDGTGWRLWQPGDELSVGDRVKVQLTIHCRRNLQYVTIIDERPATFAPVQQLPGWMWSEGVGFYRENRDAATNMHVIYMSPGTYLLTYEMNVGIAGVFTSGVATIQSQYAPELSAHSAGATITVEGKR